jgi:hypothetical protein
MYTVLNFNSHCDENSMKFRDASGKKLLVSYYSEYKYLLLHQFSVSTGSTENPFSLALFRSVVFTYL